MYLYDTDVLSALMRRDALDPLVQRVWRLAEDVQSTSSISIGELSFGAHRSGKLDLWARARTVFAPLRVFDFDAASAEVYGPLRANLEKKGTKLAEADLRIASIALANECTLVTGNEKHFKRVEGLRVENWLKR